MQPQAPAPPPREGRPISWANVGLGLGIGALGVGVGYGLYKMLAGRAGYDELEKTAIRIRYEMILKEERLAAATDPEVRRMIFEDYEREGRVLVEIIVPKMADIAGTDIITILTSLGYAAGVAVILYAAFKGAPYIAKAIKELRTVKPALQPTAYDAVLLGMMPDQLWAIGMTSADIGLTDYAIYEAQRQIGIVPPPMYMVADALAEQIASCMTAHMAGAYLGSIAMVGTNIAGATFAAFATGWTAADVAIVSTATAGVGILTLATAAKLGLISFQVFKSFFGFFGC